ncbi:hypothetical protein RSAG8_04767, partial [Rhizoctonia solani AG-8 WAC10335]
MLEELHAASSLLSAALERYLNACSALHDGCSYHSSNTPTELSDSVNKELALVKAHMGKLTQAEVVVKRARNNLASVPINVLPSEVLVHIFHLVLVQQPCPLQVPYYWNSESTVRFPKYPDTFSHVCSRWRRIANASHELWSHIDIALSCSLSKGFCNRAVAYVARAHQAPLDIHFIDPGCIRRVRRPTVHDYDSEQESSDAENDTDDWNKAMYINNPKEFTFLAPSARPRIRSLGLLAHEQYHPIHNKALEHCLVNSLPSSLFELVTDVSGGGFIDPSFFETSLDLQNRKYASNTHFSGLLSEQQIESAWRSTATLYLRDRYNRWTSTAYRGLIELRLLGGSRISGSELTGILGSSPGLRILHCDFNVSDSPPLRALTIPVILQELEVLNLKGMDQGNIQRFLRWLKPGLKPLRLTLCSDPTSALLKDFFARSNVQEIRVTERRRPLGEQPLPPDMFFLPSQLRTLVMIDWGRIVQHRIRARPTSLGLHNGIPSKKLDTLYMLSCRYDNFDQFHDVVANYSPQSLVLWKCSVGRSYLNSSKIDMPFLESMLGEGLPQFCPSVECLTSKDPCPLQDWN